MLSLLAKFTPFCKSCLLCYVMKENKFLNMLLVSFNALKIASTKDCITKLPNHDDRLVVQLETVGKYSNPAACVKPRVNARDEEHSD